MGMSPTAAKGTMHRQALLDLIRAHQVGLWRYLRYLGCSVADVEDVIQETFLAVWRNPFEVRDPAATNGYLRRVARNQYLMTLRRRRPTAVGDLLQTLDVADENWELHAGPDDGGNYTQALRVCMQKLTEKIRLALELSYAGMMSREEVASTLGMMPNGLKSMLRRARTALRTCIRLLVAE